MLQLLHSGICKRTAVPTNINTFGDGGALVGCSGYQPTGVNAAVPAWLVGKVNVNHGELHPLRRTA
jgi:hypothetical protein